MKKHIKIVTIGVKHLKRAILKSGAAALAVAVAAASLGVPANAAGTAETGIKSSLSSSAILSDDASTDFLTYYNLKIFDGVLTGYEMKSQYDETDVPSGLSLEIPSGVTSIGENAFTFCDTLKSVTIPSGVTDIGDGAFWNCDGLTTASIPSGVKSIGNGAFGGCRNLTGVVIPSGVISIGHDAFYCTSLTSVDIPASVTSIGMSAFEECFGLTSVEIPAGVTSIGGAAFYGCFNLDSVTFDSAQTLIYDDSDTLPSQAVIYGYDPSTAKDYAAKYGRTFKLITEAPAVLESIAVTTPPSKTTYLVGDLLDITGLVVTGTYSDGSQKTEPVTAADISGFDSSAPADSEVLTVIFGQKTAAFTVAIKPHLQLKIQHDNNSFRNFSGDFFNIFEINHRYCLSDRNFYKLVHNQSHQIQDLIYNDISSEVWSGSCYGISTTMILSKLNEINIKNYDAQAQNYYEMKKPADDSDVRDLIHYYQLSLDLPVTADSTFYTLNPKKNLIGSFLKKTTDVRTLLRNIVDKAKAIGTGKAPFVLDLGWNQSGHAVVCNSYIKDADGYNELQIVDPNVVNLYQTLYIADDYSSYLYNNGGDSVDANNWTYIGYMDVDSLNSINIDAGNQLSSHNAGGAAADSLTGTTMYLNSPGSFTVKDASGNLFSCADDGTISGNLSPSFIAPLCDGSSGGGSRINFPQTGVYTVTPAQDSMDVSMLDSGSFASVNESGAANMVFKSGNAVDINGNNINYTASVPDPKSDGNIQISSNSGKSVSIAQNSQGVVVSSSDLQNLTIGTVREPTGENTSETVSTDKNSVLIEDKTGDSTGAVQVLVSSNNDGNFDKVIGQTAVTLGLPSYSLVYTAGAGGTINGAASQTVSKGGSGTAVTAVADSGYHFVKWSDGQTTASRVDKNVSSSINVTALFAANSGTASSQSSSNPAGTSSQPGILNPNTGDDKMGLLSLIFAGIAICSAAFSIKLKKKR